MSAAKQKEAKTKSNIKLITKAKIVLANPCKPKVPSLENTEFDKLQELLIKAIKESNQMGRVYATSTNINIGLESTLRSINNCKAGCVLLSSNIKPKYVLGLIARNVEVKDAQVPVYVQSELEAVTRNIFNISALALTLPKHSHGLSDELQLWIEQHLRPKETKKPSSPEKPLKLAKAKQKILAAPSPKQVVELRPSSVESETVAKNDLPWGGDYISFSNDKPMDIDEDLSSNDHVKLQDALNKLINKVKQPATIFKSEVTELLPTVETQEKSSSHENSEDDFLGSYAPLILNKIRPNPNRKPRKKRPKAKKSKTM